RGWSLVDEHSRHRIYSQRESGDRQSVGHLQPDKREGVDKHHEQADVVKAADWLRNERRHPDHAQHRDDNYDAESEVAMAAKMFAVAEPEATEHSRRNDEISDRPDPRQLV